MASKMELSKPVSVQDAEKQHFCKIVTVFKSYRPLMLKRLEEKVEYINRMPQIQQGLLKNYLEQIEWQKSAIMHNNRVIKLIIEDVENMFQNVQHEYKDTSSSAVHSADLEKVQSTLKQIIRDWSYYGKTERESCYGPIICKIEDLFPNKSEAGKVNILVPGAGLGRLAYELAIRGYSCQGNEFSLYMLFTSNFVLNKINASNSLSIYPWVYSGCNMLKSEDQLTRITFPDVNPSKIPSSVSFTMTAGDFLDVYTQNEIWECVATCFFIDCAKNIIEFIESIYNILKPGGYWVNLGPLLYHYSDEPLTPSIEPSYEIIREIILGMGFNFIDEKINMKTTYTQQKNSMLQSEYLSVFFAVQKPSSISVF